MYYTLHQRLRKIELDFTPASNLSHMNLVQPDASQADSIQPNTPSSDSASDNPTCIKTVLTLRSFAAAKQRFIPTTSPGAYVFPTANDCWKHRTVLHFI